MLPRTLLAPLFMASLTAASAADRLAPSTQPPAGLTAAQVPQFVLLGFDDNPDVDPMTWFVDHLATRRQADGTPVRAIFYSNGRYWTDPALVAVHQRAFAAGHEIGNHTQNHEHGTPFTVAQWQAEMKACDDTFTAAGIPREAIVGFRTPFLEYNSATFAALAATGRRYDTSIEEGDASGQDGTNFLWPYTLDAGSPGNAGSFAADSGKRVGNHPGLWEIPIHVFLVPADAECAQYGVKPGLRARIGTNLKLSYGGGDGAPVEKITGLDWNVLEAAKCDGPEFLAILKYTLDHRLAGNRAPFMVGGHTALYPADKPDRRKAIEDFVTYALSKPEVRFVTGTQLVDWLRAPAAVK